MCAKLLRMSDTSGEHYGPSLAAYIDSLRRGMSVRQFAALHNLDPARISTWRGGATPSLTHLRHVADGLDITLGQLLVEIGFGTPADFTITDGPRDQSVERAVETDPDLLEHERVMLRDFLVMLRKVREGAESVTIRNKRTGRRSRERDQ